MCVLLLSLLFCVCRAAGYSYYGSEPLYNGLTGQVMQADIFLGVVFYQRLRYEPATLSPMSPLLRELFVLVIFLVLLLLLLVLHFTSHRSP